LITRDMNAYSYLADSTNNFIAPENLTEQIRSVGFSDVQFNRRMFGIIAIHTARKTERLENVT
jgi:ubiquinone/menaquinone biosynthesis C-methylase UbiE